VARGSRGGERLGGRAVWPALAALVALAFTITFVVRELDLTSARTADAIMSMAVTEGGTCFNQSKCAVPLGGEFTITISADVPPAERYVAWQTELDYSELVTNGGSYQPRLLASDEIVFSPLLAIRIPGSPGGDEGLVSHADVTQLPVPTETDYSGPLVELDFTCSGADSTNVLQLVPYSPFNYNGTAFRPESLGGPFIPAKATGLTVHCGEPPPTPTACPDDKVPAGGGGCGTPTSTATSTDTPTATPTPCPGDKVPLDAGCGTATPTATATATPDPALFPEFSLHVSGAAVCDEVANPTKCSAAVGQPFTLTVSLDELPTQGGYTAIQLYTVYGQLIYKPTSDPSQESLWPDEGTPPLRAGILGGAPLGNEGTVLHGLQSSVLHPHPVSTFSGDILRIQLTCPQIGMTENLGLLPYKEVINTLGTGLKAPNFENVPAKTTGQAALDRYATGFPQLEDVADYLTINCVQSLPPTPTPPPPTPASVGGVGAYPDADGGARGWWRWGAMAAGGAAMAGGAFAARRVVRRTE